MKYARLLLTFIVLTAVAQRSPPIFAESSEEAEPKKERNVYEWTGIVQFGFVSPGIVGRPTRGAIEFDKRIVEKNPLEAFETWFDKGNHVEKAFSLIGLYRLDREAYLTKKNSITNWEQKIPCASGGCVVRPYTKTLGELIAEIENDKFHFRLLSSNRRR